MVSIDEVEKAVHTMRAKLANRDDDYFTLLSHRDTI